MKVIAFLSIAILMISAYVPGVMAKGEGYISVSSSYDTSRGVTELTVDAEQLNDLYAGQFELNYNPEFGYVRAASKGAMLENAQTIINTDQADSGQITVAFAAESELPDSGEVATIEFYTSPSAGVESTGLSLSNTGFFNSEYEEMQPAVSDGFIKPFDGTEKEEMDVPADKTWTIEFNTAMKETSLNDSSVYIVNSAGDKVDADLQLSNEGTAVTITPSGDFNSRYSYEVIVTDNVLSESGVALKQAVKLPFSIQ